MDNSKREAYEKWIDRIRKFVAIAMLFCGVLMIFRGESRSMIIIIGLGALTCIFLAIALAFEYLIRVLFFRPGRQLPWYQFSISGMLILTTCVAVVCAWLKILGPNGIWWLILVLVIIAGSLETWLIKKK